MYNFVQMGLHTAMHTLVRELDQYSWMMSHVLLVQTNYWNATVDLFLVPTVITLPMPVLGVKVYSLFTYKFFYLNSIA